MSERTIFIVSDLHLGGEPPKPEASSPGDDGECERRGFRMMTRPKALAEFVDALIEERKAELIINGDFVDFLAESHDGRFHPFLYDERKAVETFRRIAGWRENGRTECVPGRAQWDPLVFDALARYLSRGKPLTLLLGNHDLELCLPAVREELVRRLGGGELHFRYDDEALPIGTDVLVEHGNLYDRANVVDHKGLRKLRAELTRGLTKGIESTFTPPVGSQIVSNIMNPIKARYGFIDLLKPESEALFALLIAIEPDTREKIGGLLRTLGGIPIDSVAAMRGDGEAGIRGGRSTRDGSNGDAVATVMGQLFGRQDADLFLQEVAAVPAGSTMRGGWKSKLGLIELLLGADGMDTRSRVAAIRRAMDALVADKCFNVNAEAKTYGERAEQVAREGRYKYVVFGHTHLAKCEQRGSVRYLNSGTWANLMAFPQLPDSDALAEQELTRFVEHVKHNQLDGYIRFLPTYVRLDLSGAQVERAGLYLYEGEKPINEQVCLGGYEGACT